MKVISLQSGSNGNSIYVEARGVRLLVDAGISGREAEQRLASHGRAISEIDALLISHDHSDHTRCMGVYQRRFGLPIHITERSMAAAAKRRDFGRLDEVRPFAAGTALRFDEVCVETIPTPHDSADGVAFVVDDGRQRLGILTDLGHVFDELKEVVGSLDAVIIESNYDEALLACGPYPANLKARIRGPGGHLSNDESAQLLAVSAGPRLQWACLAHLSERNNEPRLALAAHRKTLQRKFPLCVASRYKASDVLSL